MNKPDHYYTIKRVRNQDQVALLRMFTLEVCGSEIGHIDCTVDIVETLELDGKGITRLWNLRASKYRYPILHDGELLEYRGMRTFRNVVNTALGVE